MTSFASEMFKMANGRAAQRDSGNLITVPVADQCGPRLDKMSSVKEPSKKVPKGFEQRTRRILPS